MKDYRGQTIDHYIMKEQLGQGGMAVVYKAFDTRLERDVAIKLIRTDEIPPSQLELLLKRFEREAKSQARFSHPNIVPVFDFGEYQGVPYLVMEYLQGGTLRDKMHGPLPLETTLNILAPIASGLAYAHELGVIHRDMKPSNILFNYRGRPMLTDFGIAKLLESNQATLTGTGLGVGTPEYMAPEQWKGTVVPQTDIYALGVVMYEMITGAKPYTAETPVAVALKQMSEPIRRPSEFVPDIPENVELVLLKMLAKQPENRQTSMLEFYNELIDLQSGHPVLEQKKTEKPIEVTPFPASPLEQDTSEDAGTFAEAESPDAAVDEGSGVPKQFTVSPGQVIPDARSNLADENVASDSTVDMISDNAATDGDETIDEGVAVRPVVEPVRNKARTKIPDTITTENEKSLEKEKLTLRDKHKFLIWAGILIGLVGIIGIIGLLYGLGKLTKKSSPQISELPTLPVVIGNNTPTTAAAIYTPTIMPTSIPEFVNLPEPNAILDNSEGKWQIFSGVNMASSMVMRDGVLWTASGSGGVVAWDPGSGDYKQYLVFDGLVSNSIYSLVLSSENEIWAGTWENGISRFNGSGWEVVDSQGLSQIVSGTSDGSVWAYSSYDVRLGFYQNGNWRMFSANDGLPSGARGIDKVVSDPNGGIWVQTFDDNNNWTVSHCKNGNWRHFTSTDGLPEAYFQILGVSSNDELWLIDESNYILKFDGENSRSIVPLPEFDWSYSSLVTSDNILMLAYRRNDNDQGSGIISIEGDTLSTYTVENGLPSNDINSLYIDPNGELWVSTLDGLAKSVTDNAWQLYGTQGSILSGQIQSISMAPDGSLWVASLGGGASHYDGNSWQNYTTRSGLESNAFWSSAIAPDGTVWLGTWYRGTIMSFDGTTWQSYGEADGLASGGYVWSLTVAINGTVWAGTSNGVASFTGHKWQMYTSSNGPSLNDVRSIVVDQSGDVWISSYDYESGGKIARFSDGVWKVYDTEDGLTAGDAVMALAISPDGALFAGTYNGLFRLVNNRWEAIIENPTYINDIAFTEDGALWIATEFDGIQKFDNNFKSLENYRLGDGLPGLRMKSIAVTSDGVIWAGGEGGVARFSPKVDIGSTRIRQKDNMELVYIPAGTFTMGVSDEKIEWIMNQNWCSDCERWIFDSGQPEHEVFLDAYWIDKNEITNKQYSLCVSSGACKEPSNFGSSSRSNYIKNSQFADYPVIYVSWFDAKNYCTWAGGRLPTEAEWEKAARGTDGRIYPWGNNAPTSQLANSSLSLDDTTEVGSFLKGASPYGILDMVGNVWEWLADWHSDTYYKYSSRSNPTGPISGDSRSLRGGGWSDYDVNYISTSRNANYPNGTSEFGGFRCVVSEQP